MWVVQEKIQELSNELCLYVRAWVVQEKVDELSKRLAEMNWRQEMMEKKMEDMSASAAMFVKTMRASVGAIGTYVQCSVV